jgi:thymidine kinase
MIEVICGPMYSGKSDELIRRLSRAQIGGKSIAAIKPRIDNRYSEDHIVSHSGSKLTAYPLENVASLQRVARGYDVIGIDEAQFYDGELIYQVQSLPDKMLVIIAGLDMTFRKEPFGPMPQLLAIADRVQKLTAVCHKCGEDATLTQRLLDGRPASFDDATIVVGGRESYEARCRECFQPG